MGARNPTSVITWWLSIATMFAFTILAMGCVVGCKPARSASSTTTSNTTHIMSANAPALPPDAPLLPPRDAASKSAPQAQQSGESDPMVQGASTAVQGASTASEPPSARPPIRRVGRGGIADITFDDLKLDMPVGTLFDSVMLTPRVRQLDGTNVRLRGFIFAGGVFQTTGIKSFPFVMNTQCKFGPQGLAYCVILVELDKGMTTDFTTYPVTVEGKLSVQPFNANGFTWSVYHLRGTKVF